MRNYDVIILGAGAAGLMCASVAAKRGRRVLLLDQAEAVGKKILISGGGRCNFTNTGATRQAVEERYLSANPHFAKSAMGRFSPQDFITMVDAAWISWHEKTLGQLFCDGSAKQIVAMLLDACSGVDVKTSAHVDAIAYRDGRFYLTVGGDNYETTALVVATGGPSIPKMGATGFAYDVARQFRLKIIEPRPALVPLTLGGDELLFRELSGVSAPVVARCGKTRFQEAALFTHRGLSGPAILQISSYWNHGQSMGIDFIPDEDAGAMLLSAKRSNPRSTLRSVIDSHLPARLAQVLSERLGTQGNLADQPDRVLAAAGAQLNDWRFAPNGTEGYAKAEVTIGGISTDMLDQKTLMTKSVPGLYFIGECVDVTGWLGGYNFQWAWASGVAAGQAV